MDDPTPLGRYLCCQHITSMNRSPITGKLVRTLTYDMTDFLVECKSVYSELSGVTLFKKVKTPFLNDNIHYHQSPNAGPAMAAARYTLSLIHI